MRRSVIILFTLAFILPLVSANVDFSGSPKEYYNIGDKIPVQIVLSSPEPSLLKSSMDCNARSVLYFVTPLDENSPSQISVPDFTASSQLIGECHITLSVESLEGNTLLQKSSSSFQITKDILLDTLTDKLEYKPGDTIKISGSIRKRSAISFKNASVLVSFDGEVKSLEARDTLDYAFPIKPTTRSGKREIEVTVRDGGGNEGSEILPITILPKATSMNLIMNGKEYFPKSSVEFKMNVLDQADESMSVPIKAEIRNPSGTIIQSLEISSGMSSTFTLDKFASPGTYTLRGSVAGISKEDRFYVKSVMRIDSRYENEMVIITNVGNVKYENKTSIILESKGKKYIITKDLQSETIDLSQEVPAGTYTITLPDSENGTAVRDVGIQDNRPLMKKLKQGLSSITGKNTDVADSGTSGLHYAPYVLLIILIAVIVYFVPKDKLKFPKFSFGKKIEEPSDRQNYINTMFGKKK